jgi:hypothetical protein
MIGAAAFAIALGGTGYSLSGWIWAILFPLIFLVLVPPLNWVVISKAPEEWNVIITFQAVKWILFVALVGLMLALKYG